MEGKMLKNYEQFINSLFSGESRWMTYLLWLFISGLFFTIVILEIAAGLYLAVFIAAIFYFRNRPLELINYLFLAFVISGLLSGMLSGHYNVLMYLIPICFIPISVQLKENKSFNLETWIKWILFFATVTALVGVFYHYTGRERTTGTYGGYFIFATLMSWSIPLTLAMVMKIKGRWGIIYLGISVLMLIGLWWSYTRSAMLGLFIGFGCWVLSELIKNWYRKTENIGKIILRWMVFLLPLFLLLLFIFLSDDPRMNPTARNDSQSESTIDFSSGRMDIIANAISILQTDITSKNFVNIIFGHGPFSYQRLVQGPYSSWESDYLHSLMEQGLIGFILVLSIYYFLLKHIIKGLRSDDYLLNGLATAGIITLVMSFFTLRITGWHSVGVFIIIYNFLVRGLADEEKA